MGYDARSAWSLMREAIASFDPEMADELELGLSALRDTAGVDLESDLIEQLTGEFAEILVPIQLDPATPGVELGMGMMMSPFLMGLTGIPGSSPGSVVVVGLHETGPVEDMLETLLQVSGAGELIEDEQVAGRWMTSVVPPDVSLRPSWAFLDDALLFSLQAEPVRAVLLQAAEDAPPSWLEGEGRRAALAADDAAFAWSAADLDRWLQAEVVSPLAWMSWMFPEDPAASDSGAPEPADALHGILATLPELVAEHLRGTMCSTTTVDRGVLVYRVWTQ